MKKLISSALSAIMLIGAMGFATVSAADTDVTKTVHFNDLTLESSATISDDFSDMNYSDNNANSDSTRRYTYSTAAGMYGKEATDNSLRIYKPYVGFKNKWSTDAAEVSKPSFRYYQLHYNANLTGGNYYHVSTELAVAAGTTYEPTLKLYCDDTLVAYLVYDSEAKVYNVKTTADGDTLATMPTTQWAKFDVVMDASNQVADLYFNGLKIAEDIALTTDVETNGFGKFKLMAECSYRYSSSSYYVYSFDEVDVYMDNLTCSALAEDPGIDRKSEDFNDMTLESSATISDDFSDMNYSDNNANSDSTRRYNYSTAAGMYGKEASDNSLRIYKPYVGFKNKWSTDAAEVSKPSFRYYQLHYSANLTGGSYYHVSTELAVAANTSNEPTLKLYCDDTLVAYLVYDSEAKVYNIKLTADGDTLATMPTTQWAKFDVVMDASNQVADLYYNGTKIAEDIALTTDVAANGFGKFKLMAECIYAYTASGYYVYNFHEVDVYMDNLLCAALAEEPVIEPEVEAPTELEITAVGEAELQENAENLYKKGFTFTIEDMGTYNSILLEDEGEVIAGFNIADMFDTIISGGAVRFGLQVYDIPEESKDLTAELSTIVLD